MKKTSKNTKTATEDKATVADLIWGEIQNRPIEMFALPNQTVKDHCAPVPVEPSKLYLTMKSAAVLPALEKAIGVAYEVELADKFVIVKRAPALF